MRANVDPVENGMRSTLNAEMTGRKPDDEDAAPKAIG